MMKMNKLATLLLTTSLTFAGGAFAATSSTSDSSNGDANAAASAGQVAPDAKQNLEPNNVDNSKINTGDPATNSNKSSQHMTKDEVHKNSMCKDGRCPDENKKVETGNGNNTHVNTKTDGTTQ